MSISNSSCLTSSVTTGSVSSSSVTTGSVSSSSVTTGSVSSSISSIVSGQHSNARTLYMDSCAANVITLRGRLRVKELPTCNSLGVENASCLCRAVLAASGGLHATPLCDVNIESMRGAVRQHVVLYGAFLESVCGRTWLNHSRERVVAEEFSDECLQVIACSVSDSVQVFVTVVVVVSVTSGPHYTQKCLFACQPYANVAGLHVPHGRVSCGDHDDTQAVTTLMTRMSIVVSTRCHNYR